MKNTMSRAPAQGASGVQGLDFDWNALCWCRRQIQVLLGVQGCWVACWARDLAGTTSMMASRMQQPPSNDGCQHKCRAKTAHSCQFPSNLGQACWVPQSACQDWVEALLYANLCCPDTMPLETPCVAGCLGECGSPRLDTTPKASRRGLTAAGDALHLHDVAVAGGHDVGLHGVPRRLDDVLGRPHPVQRLVGAEAGAAPQPGRAVVRPGRIPLQLRCRAGDTAVETAVLPGMTWKICMQQC